MEANEAPEKIYIQKENSYSNILKYNSDWTPIPIINKDNIEYIRIDVFIEKVCNWLIDNIHNYTDDGTGEHSFVMVKSFIENFTSYMKGENYDTRNN